MATLPGDPAHHGCSGRHEHGHYHPGADCVDGFTEAYFARPERFLDPAVRQSQSAWGFAEEAAIERGITQLRADLDSGAWDRR